MLIKISFIFLLSISSSLSHVLSYKVAGRVKKRFTYKEVCEDFGGKHLLLVHAVNTKSLDCMGESVDIFSFCKKKFKGKNNFLRGYINQKLDEAVCEFGESSALRISCQKSNEKWCHSPLKSCQKLREYFAFNLELSHHSQFKKERDNVLNCHYTLKAPKERDLKLSNIVIKAPQDWEVELRNDKVFNSLNKNEEKAKVNQPL